MRERRGPVVADRQGCPGVSEGNLVVGEDGLHVVFGTGQVGSALAAHLAGLGMAVRAVSRHRPPALAAGALLLGTAAAGFHDLAPLRTARPPAPARPSPKTR